MAAWSSVLWGSSRNRSSGSNRSILPITRRRFMPVLKVRTFLRAWSARPTSVSALLTAPAPTRIPCMTAANCRFSSAVNSSYRWRLWVIIPIRRRMPSRPFTRSRPRTRPLPAVGLRAVARSLRSVVFPAPLGPSRATTSPRSTRRSTASRASVCPNTLVRPCTSTMDSATPLPSASSLRRPIPITDSPIHRCSVAQPNRRTGETAKRSGGGPAGSFPSPLGPGQGHAQAAQHRRQRRTHQRAHLDPTHEADLPRLHLARHSRPILGKRPDQAKPQAEELVAAQHHQDEGQQELRAEHREELGKVLRSQGGLGRGEGEGARHHQDTQRRQAGRVIPSDDRRNGPDPIDRKSTRLNSSHQLISY